MNRDRLKYRVWGAERSFPLSNKKNEVIYKMIYLSMFQTDGDYIIGGYDGSEGLYITADTIIMMSTGRKDINKQLIYEGDLFKLTGNLGELRWDDEWSYELVSAINDPIFFTVRAQKDLECIGNIYENKELLK